MMRKVSCLFIIVLLIGFACAQADQPSKDQLAQAPATPTPDTQARARAGDPWSCEVPIPSNPTTRLAHVCGNHAGRPRVITRVACLVPTGTLEFIPELTGAGPTSILARPLSCTATWTEGVLNGEPRVRTFTKAPMTCVGSCTIDFVVANVTGITGGTLVITGEYD